MARWTASAKWAEGPALDGQRDMPLALRLSEGLGLSGRCCKGDCEFVFFGPCEQCSLCCLPFVFVPTLENSSAFHQIFEAAVCAPTIEVSLNCDQILRHMVGHKVQCKAPTKVQVIFVRHGQIV